MTRTILRTGMAALLALGLTTGLAACGGSDDGASGTASQSESADGGSAADAGDTGESAEFVQDLQDGVDLINDKIAEQAGMTQIMLASDVDQATQKYGMWVLPYYPSDAVKKYTMQIQIENGTDFVVTAISAATDKTWEMDQDGTMTEKTE